MGAKGLHFAVEFGLLVQDVLLDQLLLGLSQVEHVHFALKHVPALLAVAFLLDLLVVLVLDVGLRIFSPVLHALRYLLLTRLHILLLLLLLLLLSLLLRLLLLLMLLIRLPLISAYVLKINMD